MAPRIVDLEVHDVRFPTSDHRHGSDAMNPEPDYSAAVVILKTDDPGLQGHGMTFTIGRGNEICTRAIEAYRPLLVDLTLDRIESDPGAFWRRLAGESQLRWLGPEKGALHMALAAVVNATWDLLARRAGLPLWKYLSSLSAEALVRCVDFRHISDALTPDQALALLREMEPGRSEREAQLLREGYPAYITSVGWLGYDDEAIRALCRQAIAGGWDAFKMKVGGDPADDLRRARLMREEIGPDRLLMMDANQVWDVQEALEAMGPLAEVAPWWIEEPTHPDDVLGHARIRRGLDGIGVATGEHCANRILFKQMLQAEALDFVQLDGCRLGGVNEVITVLLLAARFGVPVCPHAGGVGLCEHVQHFSAFDYICVSGSLERRRIEYAEHLHEHFVQPVVVERGRYRLPLGSGFALEMRPESLASYAFPDGPVWRQRRGESPQ